MIDAKELAQLCPEQGTEKEIAERIEMHRSAPRLDLTDEGSVCFSAIGIPGKLRQDDAVSIGASQGFSTEGKFLGGLFILRHQWEALKATGDRFFDGMDHHHKS